MDQGFYLEYFLIYETELIIGKEIKLSQLEKVVKWHAFETFLIKVEMETTVFVDK